MNAHMWKGLGAGFAGGLIASAAMAPVHTAAAKVDGSGPPQGEDSTVKTASAISEGLFGHQLTEHQKQVAGPLVHFGFGATVGAVYGAMAEVYPVVTIGFGLPFGVAVWLGAHVAMVPALGLSKPATKAPVSKEATELAAHFVYGAVTELCRRLIRKRV